MSFLLVFRASGENILHLDMQSGEQGPDCELTYLRGRLGMLTLSP